MKILITGINGGIGMGLAQKFKERGDTVYGIDIHPKGTHHWIDKYLRIDLSKPDWTKLFTDGIDVLINNAAVQIKKDFKDFTDDDIERTFNVNLISAVKLIQKLKFNDGSNIINIGSIHSSQTKKGFSLYASSKGGLETLTKAHAVELAPRTRVNMIKPGAIETPMLLDGLSGEDYQKLRSYHPTGHIGKTEDISELVETIINNKFLNGSIIEIDGGVSSMLNDPENG